MDCLEKINKVFNALQDDESREIFKARILFAFNRNQEVYGDRMQELYQDWTCQELNARLAEIKDADSIVIFGCGHDGKRLKKQLINWGYNVEFFCDNDREKWQTKCEGITVLAPTDLLKVLGKQLIVVASSAYGEEIYEQLKQMNIPEKYILWPQYKTLIATRGQQYFDVFEPAEQEVYIDCGGFDGENVFDFCKWTNGSYKEIYVMEPMKDMCGVIQKRCKEASIKNITILNNATWNTQEKIYFVEGGAGSREDKEGKLCVNGLDIDSIVKDKKVTLIKMDIEGAELNALSGAKNTIKSHRPRLAVCIYHKVEDIYEIGAYLLELVPEYKFKIRHYASNMWETVLYAEI